MDRDELEDRLRSLVMDARQGKTESYKAFLEQLAPFVRRNSASMLKRYGQSHLLEDFTQEILLTVHLKLHTYRAELPLLAWIRVVMKHRMIDMLRRNKFETISFDEPENWEPAAPENPEIQAVRMDLSKLLGQLKPPTGEIIHAFKVQGATVKDLAKRYRMSESNIKVTVHRGLRKLSEIIAESRGH